MGQRRIDHHRSQAPQFFFEQARRPITRDRAKGVAAHQLSKMGCVVRGGRLHRAHFPQRYLKAGLGNLPRSLTTGETGSHYLYRHCLDWVDSRYSLTYIRNPSEDG